MVQVICRRIDRRLEFGEKFAVGVEVVTACVVLRLGRAGFLLWRITTESGRSSFTVNYSAKATLTIAAIPRERLNRRRAPGFIAEKFEWNMRYPVTSATRECYARIVSRFSLFPPENRQRSPRTALATPLRFLVRPPPRVTQMRVTMHL